MRTHTCGELRIDHVHEEVILCGWVQKIRDKGGMLWIDLRDRYGLTQLMLEEGKTDKNLLDHARSLGREYVIRAWGKVIERQAKNDKLTTGAIEVLLAGIEILGPAQTPPFIIEDETDGGEELRMRYRYLDLRRHPVRENIVLRHKVMQQVRAYLDSLQFMEVETPVLIKSTPEGARDFVVPSRMHPGEFYALPQSPQTFKQLLMVAGFDRYYQIVKCFRDEDLRADRQPEFTQIDCEMSFVSQEDIMLTFEGLVSHLFENIKGITLDKFPRMTYDEAMRDYGTDKPDIRFGMKITALNELVQNSDFKVFKEASLVAGICVSGCADYSRKQLDALTEYVKKPQIGARGLVYVKYNQDGSLKSSVDKFYGPEDLKSWLHAFHAQPGDLLLIMAGEENQTRKALSELRLKMGTDLGLRDKDRYCPLWVTDFPLFEWDDEAQRFHAMHHPFTAPNSDDIPSEKEQIIELKAQAYDMVINGVEAGGGSIRIHDREQQELILKQLGFSREEANRQFGFLMDAFAYGAPPHGGIAFGFDRLCTLLGGSESIRDFIAFPKNNAGRDLMIDSPSSIAKEQL